MLSYAQNGEDVVLNRVFADSGPGFYVDIGACHPLNDSVTLHFYELGWRGVNVEPDRELFEAFRESRPRDINFCAAVGRPRGRVIFHPTGTRGHGTLDPLIASDRSIGRLPERVPLIPLSDVLDCYGPDDGEIDFLKIDVEGWEAEVLASGDLTRHRPRVLVIEAVDDKGRPTHEFWEPALLASGYQFAMFDGLNRFYCREEDSERLLPRLSAPANVRDGWVRAVDAAAHEESARLRADHEAAARQVEAAAQRAQELENLHQQELESLRQQGAALFAQLEASRASEQATSTRAAESDLQVERLHGELAIARERIEAFAVDAGRARAQAASAFRREEAAEARMAELETRIRNSESLLAKYQVQNEALSEAQNDALRSAEAWLVAVRASTSWRITRPFRVVGRWVRGVTSRP